MTGCGPENGPRLEPSPDGGHHQRGQGCGERVSESRPTLGCASGRKPGWSSLEGEIGAGIKLRGNGAENIILGKLIKKSRYNFIFFKLQDGFKRFILEI